VRSNLDIRQALMSDAPEKTLLAENQPDLGMLYSGQLAGGRLMLQRNVQVFQ
jgi:hypothetical protein